MLEQQNPQIRKAVGILKELSEDERTRMLMEEREKARRDIASMVNGARKEGLQQGLQQGKNEHAKASALNALRMGLDIEIIMKISGLTREEVEKLKSIG